MLVFYNSTSKGPEPERTQSVTRYFLVTLFCSIENLLVRAHICFSVSPLYVPASVSQQLPSYDMLHTNTLH